MSGPIHVDRDLPIEEQNRIFLEKLKELPDEELAVAIDGLIFAPNPHYVNEAAKRIRNYSKELKEAKRKIRILAERVMIAHQAFVRIDHLSNQEDVASIAGNADGKMTCDDHAFKYLFYEEDNK